MRISDRKVRSSRRSWLAVLLPVTMIAGLLLGGSPGGNGTGWLGSAAAASAQVSGPAPGNPSSGPSQAEVTVPAQAKTMLPIPKAFLGLSTEYTTLKLAVEHHKRLYGRVLGELHVSGDGQFVLRIGGDTAQHVRYVPSAKPLSPWDLPFTPADVGKTAELIDGLGLRAILDVNTISAKPRQVARWMRDILQRAKLKFGKLSDFEIGNEPDLYNPSTWEKNIKAAYPPWVRKKLPPIPKQITPKSYAQTYRAFAHALPAARNPNQVPLVAPALGHDYGSWISTLLHHVPSRLGTISVHVYPYSACAKPGQAKYPTIQRILSEGATAGMRRTIAPAVALANKARLRVRLTEINSVTCGGLPGVSDAFATALWAPDGLFELMGAGVEGVNLHARVGSPNRPFYFCPSHTTPKCEANQNGLQTRPLLYGLILFTRMLGPQAHLVPVPQPRALPHLKVWAVREVDPDTKLPTLKVLLINKGNRSAQIKLHLPTNSPAHVGRLLASSAKATSGVTWAGQHLNNRAEWQGKQHLDTINPTRNTYAVSVRRWSAALLTVPVAATTLVAPPQSSPGPTPQFGYQ